MFRTGSPGASISVALRKLLQRGMWGSQAIYKFATKGTRGLNNKDQVMKLRNLAFQVWEDASLWAHWIHSFHMHLSYGGRRVGGGGGRLRFLIHFAFPQLLSNQRWAWGSNIQWIAVGDSYLEARNRWWLWHLITKWVKSLSRVRLFATP